ncbi:hypothetical protein ACFLRI_04680, partial [Bacteroidota bacterium]
REEDERIRKEIAEKQKQQEEKKRLALEAEEKRMAEIRAKQQQSNQGSDDTPSWIRTNKANKAEVFDQSNAFIYLQPKNSWPSELRSYILNPSYQAKAIGTYAYTEQEAKKEFFIEDVPELRKKFPKQFETAFQNWDYIVETYTNYQQDSK